MIDHVKLATVCPQSHCFTNVYFAATTHPAWRVHVEEVTKPVEFQTQGTSVTVNVADQPALVAALKERLAAHRGFAMATLNLDHLVKLKASDKFRAAYAAQDLITADGNPIVWLSNLARQPVDLLPGADLVVPLACIAADLGRSVALVGSTDASLRKAADALKSMVPNLDVAVMVAPPMGFDPEGEAADAILDQLAAHDVGITFIALGAPKQELFAAHGRKRTPNVGFASIGAGLDFLSGQQVRAPIWVRRMALEWLWRILNDPMRLGKRYFLCIQILPTYIRQSLKKRRGSAA